MLDELFNALLHKLMTGKVRVGDLDLSYRDAMERARSVHLNDNDQECDNPKEENREYHDAPERTASPWRDASRSS